MEVFRWCIAVPIIFLSLFIGFGQWWSSYTIPKKLNADGKPRNYSLIPLLGGVLGAMGCWIAPNSTIQSLWWVPVVIDPGCGILIISLLVFAVYDRVQRWTGGGPPLE